jgi:hypothetical protein
MEGSEPSPLALPSQERLGLIIMRAKLLPDWKARRQPVATDAET